MVTSEGKLSRNIRVYTNVGYRAVIRKYCYNYTMLTKQL